MLNIEVKVEGDCTSLHIHNWHICLNEKDAYRILRAVLRVIELYEQKRGGALGIPDDENKSS